MQKDLGVSSQRAEQISKEIITKIVPFLEKIPEEKFKDPAFVKELSKKVFGEKEEKKEVEEVKETDIFPKIKPPIGVADALEKNTSAKERKGKATILPIPPKKTEKINKPIAQEKINESTAKPQFKGQDTYREPIE